MINSLTGGAASGDWAFGDWTASPAAVSDLMVESDPTKNPQPLSLYVFLFLLTALALLLVSMITHMKRARRNLGAAESQPRVATPPQASSDGPREVG